MAQASPSGNPSPVGPSDGYLKPFSTKPPSETIFKRHDGLGKIAPIVNVNSELMKTRPVPTNKWWGNLIHTTEKENGKISQPGWSNPYALKLPVGKGPFGIQAAYSFQHRQKAPLKDGKIKHYLHEWRNDMALSAAEFTAVPSYEVYDWSDFGISVRICPTGNAAQCMDSSLVAGMAFVSAQYNGLTPTLASEFKITKHETRGNKHILHFDQRHSWVVYSRTASWQLTEPELPQNIDFYAPRKPDASLVEKYQIKQKLEDDIKSDWKIDGISYYFSGKLYQKYASLCLMADDEAISGGDKSLMRTCVEKLEAIVDKRTT
ncbi:hypothetical protein ATCC90586_007782 [Pythium insidiosum]|nr:hypothetical protein ATCC90586_007782 [Pythium insidiosum]